MTFGSFMESGERSRTGTRQAHNNRSQISHATGDFPGDIIRISQAAGKNHRINPLDVELCIAWKRDERNPVSALFINELKLRT